MDKTDVQYQVYKEEDLDLKRYLHTILRKRWILFSVMAVIMVFTTIKTFIETPTYRATALLLIDIPSSQGGLTITRENIRPSIGSVDYFVTQQNILKSAMMARRVKKKLDLPFSENELIEMIKVIPIKDSRLLNVNIDSHDPALSSRIANALVDEYIGQNIESMLFMSREVLKSFPDAKTKIEDSTVYGQLKKLEDEDAIDALPSIAYNPVIQRLTSEKMNTETELVNLSKRYKEKHPKIIALNTRLDYIKGQIALEKNRTLNIIRADLAGRLQANNIRIIDYAEVPKKPIAPNRPRDILSGFFLSVFLGLGAIFFIEYLDDSVKNKADIEDAMNMPYLGEFPVLEMKPGRDIFAETDKSADAAEAIRKIRTNIVFSSPKEELKTILVTSTIPQEGKSFISGYLAFSFAKNGIRTLLIDADTRKPSLNKFFGVDRSCGLTNVLAEGVPPDDAVKKTGYENLYIMPCGSSTPNPVELLGSERLNDVIKDLSGKFERIIIDTPPSLALSDALLLSKVSDGIVFVVKAGAISRKVLTSVRERFLVTNSKITGAIMNFFEMEEHSYYKDRYYHKYYKNYYNTDKANPPGAANNSAEVKH